MRKKIIAGNWKMNKTVPEGLELVDGLKPLVQGVGRVDIVVCPPFTALYPVGKALEGSRIALGAQNVFWKKSGAYTSQISPGMLTDLGVQYAIIGHSETRGRFGVPEEGADEAIYRYFGESDKTVNLKAKAALAAGLTPIICIGETLDERQANKTDSVVQGQVSRALDGLSPEDVASRVVFAYEPVWAIGTGEVCGDAEADRVCGLVRGTVGEIFSQGESDAVRVQYGGSMKPDNAADLLARPNIDGGLIGGASLKAADFAAIVKAAGQVSH
ncbi:MAG TPA: triose-phosphate isomerase [Capsulimonadaceae bacterium]|nr:triose-phosphate isomerase [Capsulimonadaceae bacterium]